MSNVKKCQRSSNGHTDTPLINTVQMKMMMRLELIKTTNCCETLHLLALGKEDEKLYMRNQYKKEQMEKKEAREKKRCYTSLCDGIILLNIQ